MWLGGSADSNKKKHNDLATQTHYQHRRGSHGHGNSIVHLVVTKDEIFAIVITFQTQTRKWRHWESFHSPVMQNKVLALMIPHVEFSFWFSRFEKSRLLCTITAIFYQGTGIKLFQRCCWSFMLIILHNHTFQRQLMLLSEHFSPINLLWFNSI